MRIPIRVPTSYMLGAIAGSRKCWFACSPAMTNPAIENNRVAIRFRRIRSATRACCSGPKPWGDADIPTHERSDSSAITIENPAATRKTRLAIRENISQASFRLLFPVFLIGRGSRPSPATPRDQGEEHIRDIVGRVKRIE